MGWVWTVLGVGAVAAAFAVLAWMLRGSERNDDGTHGGGRSGDVTCGGE